MDNAQATAEHIEAATEANAAQIAPVALAQILDAVSHVLGLSRCELVSIRRKKDICEGRQIYYWIARKFTSCSFPMIGRHCGKRDHSTVQHGAAKVEALFPEFEERITAVLGVLGIDSEVTE